MVKYEKVIKMLAPKFYCKWAIPKNNMTNNNNCLIRQRQWVAR